MYPQQPTCPSSGGATTAFGCSLLFVHYLNTEKQVLFACNNIHAHVQKQLGEEEAEVDVMVPHRSSTNRIRTRWFVVKPLQSGSITD